METLAAFAMGQANKDKRSRVFDWDRAAELIRDQQPAVAAAGLAGDWEWTGGEIWRDGEPIPQDDTYTYLSSTWAIPELELDGDLEPCWRWKDETDWNAATYWPESALAIVGAA